MNFGNLGGQGNVIPDEIRAVLDEHFGTVAAWRRDFVATAQSLAGGSGWAMHVRARVSHVGCNVTRTLRDRGFDARYIRGGISAWYAGEGRARCGPRSRNRASRRPGVRMR